MTNSVKVATNSFVSQLIGPICLLCTLFLAGKAHLIPNYDLLIVSIFGLFSCAKWRFKGCLMALGLLALSSCSKHFFYTDHHVWQGVFELSVACAMIITTLVFQENAKYVEGVKAQNIAQSQTIEFLEEDLAKVKHLAADEVLQNAEKILHLQLQLEEALSESSSYQILNDVLRKSTARAIEEKEGLISRLLQSDRRSGQLLSEIDGLQNELMRIGNESAIIAQNEQLLKELNEARFREAQTHLVNETLARMHRTENGRLKDQVVKCEELTLQLQKANEELESSVSIIEELQLKIDTLSASEQRQFIAHQEQTQALEADLVQIQNRYLSATELLTKLEPQCAHLQAHVNLIESELAQKNSLLLDSTEQRSLLERSYERLTQEKQFLENHLQQLQAEILQAPPSITVERESELLEKMGQLQANNESLTVAASTAERLQEQLETLQSRLAQYTELELLYRQLKGNFQEKTKTLHQTRVQLFRVDTELQTLKQQIEENELEGEPLIPEMTKEIEELTEESQALATENRQLNELITQLMQSPQDQQIHIADAVHAEFSYAQTIHHDQDASSVKKKVKKQRASPDQQDFFSLL